MKNFIITISLLFLGLGAFAQNETTQNQIIKIAVLDNISSQDMGSNKNAISAIVFEDVLDNQGNVLISNGTPVNTSIKRKRRRPLGIKGKVNLTFNDVQTVSGETIKINASQNVKGKSKMGKALGIGIGTGIFFPPMLFYTLKRGGEAQIPANTIIYGTVSTTNKADMKLSQN